MSDFIQRFVVKFADEDEDGRWFEVVDTLTGFTSGVCRLESARDLLETEADTLNIAEAGYHWAISTVDKELPVELSRALEKALRMIRSGEYEAAAKILSEIIGV